LDGLRLSGLFRARSEPRWHALRWLLLRRLYRINLSHSDMRPFHNIVENFFLLLLLESCSRFVSASLRRTKRICTLARAFSNKDMSRVNLLFVFAVLLLGLSFFELNDVVAKLRLNNITNLSRPQRICCLLKFRDHLAMAKPA